MEEGKLSKSLDDIIKEQREQKSKPKSSRRSSGAQKKVGDKKMAAPKIAASKVTKGGSGKPGSAGKPRRDRNKIKPENIRITVQNTDRDNRPFKRGAPKVVDPERQNPQLREQRLEGDGKWAHDMYREGRPRSKFDPKAPSAQGTKLYISNLFHEVTDADIKELFETCGPLVEWKVHFGRDDRSLGTAHVIYRNKSDAEKALQRYNTIQLDGQPMQIELIPQAAGGADFGGRKLTSGIRITGGPNQGAVRMVSQATRQATGGGFRRGGGFRSDVDRMQE